MLNEAVAALASETGHSWFRRYLEGSNELLRSAAIRALPAVSDDLQAMRAVLIESLLDPDPDIRSDAMEALAGVACAEDADTIRRSLQGDPVREVKLTAVGALARLNDRASVDLLRSLVLSRSEDRVAWEDEAGDWEDWLDVQIAAIAALGEMGVTEAVEDLLAARADEFGQTLDVQVFDALGKMGADGVDRLLAIVRSEARLAGQRAADALARVSPEALEPHIDTLLASDNPHLRTIAMGALAADDARVRDRVTEDPDANVRLAALNRAAPQHAALAVEALTDRDPSVQAAALGHLQPPLAPKLLDALVDNMLAWLDSAPPVLMTAAARHLPAFAPDRAEAPLLALIADANCPLEARVAGVAALDAVTPAVATETFAGLLANPAQQVRSATLVVLRARAEAGDAAAVDAIAKAITGSLLAEDASGPSPDNDHDGPDASTPKGEGVGVRHIRITRDGDIEEIDPAVLGDTGQSTLSSILNEEMAAEPAMAEDTPEESSAKRRKRRAVEGPHQVAETLSCEAMQVCADLGLERIEAALLARLADASDVVRRTAWRALEAHCRVSGVCEQSLAMARAAISDTDPVMRHVAFAVLARHDPDHELIATAEKDPDALLRAAAVTALPPDAALNHLADDVLAVRRVAADRILAFGSDETVSSAVDRLVSAERADTLATVLASSAPAQARALEELDRDALPPRKALVLLNAFAELQGAAG